MDALSATFWALYAAHMVADYALQPNWMVVAKHHWWGRSLHAGAHLVAMVAMVGSAWVALWPHLLILTGIHFLVDTAKISLYRARADWVIGPYLLDQLWHLLTVIAMTQLIYFTVPSGLLPHDAWPVYVIAYVIATPCGFITERVFWHNRRRYVFELNRRSWERMAARAGLLTVLLWPLGRLPDPAPALAVVSILALLLHFPYTPGPYRQREITTDVAVAVGCALLVWIAV